MDQENRQELFEDKFAAKLGMGYEEWLETAPTTESEAFARCQQIDDELKEGYDEWYDAEGDRREELQEYRERLKLDYDIIEELFGLELHDR